MRPGKETEGAISAPVQEERRRRGGSKRRRGRARGGGRENALCASMRLGEETEGAISAPLFAGKLAVDFGLDRVGPADVSGAVDKLDTILRRIG